MSFFSTISLERSRPMISTLLSSGCDFMPCSSIRKEKQSYGAFVDSANLSPYSILISATAPARLPSSFSISDRYLPPNDNSTLIGGIPNRRPDVARFFHAAPVTSRLIPFMGSTRNAANSRPKRSPPLLRSSRIRSDVR